LLDRTTNSFRAFGGVIQAGYVMVAGVGCGTGSGVTWTINNANGGTGLAWTPTWSGGAVTSVAINTAGSGYPAVNIQNIHIENACCGSSFQHLAGGNLKLGNTELVTGVTTTAGSNVVTYTGITTDNTSLLVGASITSTDNLNPTGPANGVHETIYGTITAVTGTTITVSNNAFLSKSNEILEITPAIGTTANSQIAVRDFTQNTYYTQPGVPNVIVGGSGTGQTLDDAYMEQNTLPVSTIPFMYIGRSNKATVIDGATCEATQVNLMKPCIETAEGDASINGVSPNGNGFSILDKYWGTSVSQINYGYGGSGNSYTPQTYSHATTPYTAVSFVPSTVGWYRVVDSTLPNQNQPMVAGTMEISQPLVGGDSLWEFSASRYGPFSLSVSRANYNTNSSTWGSVTQVEVSGAGSGGGYVDLYVSSTSTSPVTVTFSSAFSLIGNSIIASPVVGATPSGGGAVIDLTTLSGTTPAAMTGSLQVGGNLSTSGNLSSGNSVFGNLNTWSQAGGATTDGVSLLSVGTTGAVFYQNFGVTAGTTYTFSFMAKSGTLNTPAFSVYDLTHSVNVVSATSYAGSINSSTFSPISVTFTAPAGTTSMRVYLLAGSGTTGTVYVTNPSVTITPSVGPSTATCAAGTNVTSCTAASGYPAPTNTRGDFTIVGGTATTGTIATISFSTTLAAAPSCEVTQNGGTALFDVGWGAPSTSSLTVTSGLSVAASTLTVHYNCQP
jgi:hypothetical protein